MLYKGVDKMGKLLKDKKIEILEGRNVAEPGNMPRYEWTPIHEGKLWAYVRHLSAREYYAAKAVQAEEEMLFIINWRNDITTDMIIKYKNRYFYIIRIDTFEGYKGDIKIYATGGYEDKPPIH